MNETVKQVLKPFASLKLTVLLLVLSMFLVFAGTSAQKEAGIWEVQHTYFHSFGAWAPLKYLFPLSNWWWTHAPRWSIPLLGGYSLIILLLVNLLSAHLVRFKLAWKRTGILLIHAGLILLISGEVVTSLFAVESQMRIDEGQTVNYSYDIRSIELAVIDTTAADHDEVVAIPGSRLANGAVISHPKLPFDVRVEKFYPNSDIPELLPPFLRQQAGRGEALANAGAGKSLSIKPLAKLPGTTEQINMPSAFVSLTTAGGENLGTYLLSTILDRPERFELNGRTYALALRFKRLYQPFQIKLIDFSFDRYTGTDTPRNFSSRVQLIDPQRNVNREVLIWMNHPLRYRGETFYQQSFDNRTERTTVLQIVRNPGWLIPYISCVMVGLGLVLHFGMHLLGFLGHLDTRVSAGSMRSIPSAKPQAAWGGIARVLWPAVVTIGCAVYVLSMGRPPKPVDGFDIAAFGRVPLSYEGRTMPMDSLARNSLRIISGKAELHQDGKDIPAIRWLLDMFAKPEQAVKYAVFRVDHPDIISLLKLDPQRKLFSYEELLAQSGPLQQQFNLLSDLYHRSGNSTKDFDLFQLKLWDLIGHLTLFNRLSGVETLYLAPPTKPGDKWKPFGDVEKSMRAGGPVNPGVNAFISMVSSYRQGQVQAFNAAVHEYPPYLQSYLPEVVRKGDFEVLFNRFEPFIASIYLYVLVFLLVLVSWLGGWEMLRRTAFWVLCLTLAVHTLGLVARIYISGRPPVTNLYSSAIFIGWAAVVLCVGVEAIYRNGIGSLSASMMAFPTLIIAHYLAPMSENGDTMHMLRAVLDTNIWLATHVVVITLGYTATFLAGIVAIVYVIVGVFTRGFANAGLRKDLSRVIYGILCFAMLFSFVGTVLGGIWADQSWGRFWGWDPKENGAVLIVLWNAIILHARWGGLIRERGMAVLAIVGNIVTSWSWFGTNMLGVGLHSYGFMESAAFWLGMFVLSQLALIALGLLPLSLWRSLADQPARKSTNAYSSPMAGAPALAKS